MVDNSNPESPQIIKFIEIPGSVDMAIKEDILYADSYVDLVAIDISNMDDIREVKRIENVFPYMIPACEDGIVENVDRTQGVVVAWKPTERRVDVRTTVTDILSIRPGVKICYLLADYNSAAGSYR